MPGNEEHDRRCGSPIAHAQETALDCTREYHGNRGQIDHDAQSPVAAWHQILRSIRSSAAATPPAESILAFSGDPVLFPSPCTVTTAIATDQSAGPGPQGGQPSALLSGTAPRCLLRSSSAQAVGHREPCCALLATAFANRGTSSAGVGCFWAPCSIEVLNATRPPLLLFDRGATT